MADFRLPSLTQRTAIIGRTGSGKTRFGTWLLSEAQFDKQPFVVLDYKREALFSHVDRIREIGVKEIPKHPGLYIIRPSPQENDSVEEWLWKIWAHEHVGLYIDEGYVLPPRSEAFTAILTQGRSKRLPVICLTQRPSWISRFVFSEADFYAVFHLNDHRDKLTVQAFTPKDRMNLSNTRLPDYCSYWYDVGKDNVFQMQPVPGDDVILETLNSRLVPRKRIF